MLIKSGVKKCRKMSKKIKDKIKKWGLTSLFYGDIMLSEHNLFNMPQ